MLLTTCRDDASFTPVKQAVVGLCVYAIHHNSETKPQEDWNDVQVTRREFIVWTVRYGPWDGILKRTYDSLIEPYSDLLHHWFHAGLKNNRARDKVQKQLAASDAGTFLVRHSERYTDSVVFNYQRKGMQQPKVKLCKNTAQGFQFPDGEVFPTLVKAIQDQCTQLGLVYGKSVSGQPRRFMYIAQQAQQAQQDGDPETDEDTTYYKRFAKDGTVQYVRLGRDGKTHRVPDPNVKPSGE